MFYESIIMRSGNSATTYVHVLTGSHSLLRMTVTLFPGFYTKTCINSPLLSVSGASLCLQWGNINWFVITVYCVL